MAQDRHRLRQARLAVALASATVMLTPRVLAGQTQNTSSAFSRLTEAAKKANEENRLDQAKTLYRKAVALRPRWTEGWWSLGTIEYDQDHYAKAAQDFEKLITVDPSNGTAHAMLGLCQFELNQDEPALNNLWKAEQLGIIKNEELRHVALYHMGILQLRARKFGDAKETLDQLVKFGVRSNELVTALGLAVLLINPKDAPPQGTPGATVVEGAGRAEALLVNKDYDQAKQAYVQLTSEYPDYPNLHFAYGRLLLETNETDAAVQQFQLELKRDPQNVSSLLEVAAVRYQVASQEALAYAEKALKLAPRLPFTHYLVGLLRLDTGNPAGAIPELEIAQKSFPNESRIFFSLGTAYARTGHKAEAAKARAEFTRLHAKERERAATVYSDRPPGLAEGQLQILGKGNPQP